MRAHPQADAIFLPSPHWPVIEAIEALEQEFGVTVMAASQACVWDALDDDQRALVIEILARLLAKAAAQPVEEAEPRDE